jgi:hypothetical protein
LKQITGFGEEQAARVVENDGGGPKRAWKPATRRTCRAADGQPDAGSGRREVDSPDWERRRGRQPQGRRASKVGAVVGRRAGREAVTEVEIRVGG